jgi:hypothetical protein
MVRIGTAALDSSRGAGETESREGRDGTLADDILTVTMLNRSAPPTPRKNQPARKRAQCQE